MKLRLMIAAVAAAAFATSAGAHEFKLGALTIGHPYAFATPATAPTAAGYLSISNAGTEPDRLIEVRADFPQAAVHATETGADGVARMAPVPALEIPPGATVTLEPRGMHVMFMGLAAPLAEGETVDATLVFEKAGEIAVQFKVEPRPAGGGGMDHGTMDHGAGG